MKHYKQLILIIGCLGFSNVFSNSTVNLYRCVHLVQAPDGISIIRDIYAYTHYICPPPPMDNNKPWNPNSNQGSLEMESNQATKQLVTEPECVVLREKIEP